MADSTLRTVLAELRRYGLKPTTEPIQGSKHIRVMWQAPNGNVRQQITGGEHATEDPRARLNARAEVRRKIKMDGIADPIIEFARKPITRKIVDAPRASEPIPLQVAELRQQIDELTELVLAMSLDQAAAFDVLAPGRAPTMMERMEGRSFGHDEPDLPVTAGVPNGSGVYVKPSPASKLQPGSMQLTIYNALANAAPLSVGGIAERIGHSAYLISGPLFQLKARGLVKSPARGWWHRHDVEIAADWQRPKPQGYVKKEKTVSDEKHEAALNAIPYHHPITSRELAKKLGKTQSAANFWLAKLRKEGLVEKFGKTFNTRWVRLQDGKVVAKLEAAPVAHPLQSTAQTILDTIPLDATISKREISHVTGFTNAAVVFHLMRLKKKGLIAMVGNRSVATWTRGDATKLATKLAKPVVEVDNNGYTPRPGSAAARIYGLIGIERPVKMSEISKKLHMPQNEVGGTLSFLKKKGVLANPERGLWIRVS